MGEIVLVRHGQASFGAANYDVLSPKGHLQARALGEALGRLAVAPATLACGAMRRHHETLDGVAAGLGSALPRTELPGLNEYAFGALLSAHLGDEAKVAALKANAPAYFRQIMVTVLAWQADEVPNPPEPFAEFRSRVMGALDRLKAAADAKGPVLAVSSGGPIALATALTLGAPVAKMVKLQMYLRNCGYARFFVRDGELMLASYNEAPHITAENAATMLTYH